MGKLIVFNHVSLDGYFVDAKGDMSWAHANDAEFNEFVENNTKGEGVLLFGRISYDLMVRFWPTPLATQSYPVVAEQMNKRPKVVFSKTMDKASWNNTKLVKENITAEIRKMKEEPGTDMVILGSGTIVSQAAQAGLVDEYQIVLNPIILGKGRTMFEGIRDKINLKLIKRRTFANGDVFLSYEPVKK